MKKQVLSLWCVCMLAGVQVRAQIDQTVNYAYSVIYNYTFQPVKEDAALKVTEVMLLQAGEDHSYFLSHNHYLNDSTLLEMVAMAEKYNSMPPTLSSRPEPVQVYYKIFKEQESKHFYYTTRLGLQRPYYRDSLVVLDWQLQDEQKMIAGHLCKKAATSFAGRDYIAWYAPDIALSDGPYKFYGLPGLILSIYDTEQHHVFTATNVRKDKKAVALQKWQGQFVHSLDTKEDFSAFVEKMKANPKKMLEQNLMQVSEEMLETAANRIKESMDRYNNPIELIK